MPRRPSEKQQAAIDLLAAYPGSTKVDIGSACEVSEGGLIMRNGKPHRVDGWGEFIHRLIRNGWVKPEHGTGFTPDTKFFLTEEGAKFARIEVKEVI